MAMSVATVSIRLRGLPSITSLMSLAANETNADKAPLQCRPGRSISTPKGHAAAKPSPQPAGTPGLQASCPSLCEDCKGASIMTPTSSATQQCKDQLPPQMCRDGLPVDSSIIHCVFQGVTLPCLAHVAVEGGVYYKFLAKLLLLHRRPNESSISCAQKSQCI